jgi:Glycosyltransferase family 87
MNLTRGARHANLTAAIIATFCAILAVVYGIAWFAPSVGLYHDDGVYLVTAESLATGHGYTIDSLPTAIPQTKYPPVFPIVLALFTLVSRQTQWLKLLPLLCTVAWLALSYRLLRRMGAKNGGAWLLVLITAASPTVVFLGTNLMSEPLFALFTVATLLLLLDERAFLAGVCAGLATLTRSAGVPLIAACMIVFVVRHRFRSAAQFTAAAMLFVAPWFGWVLANASGHPYYSGADYAASSILTSLHASEKLVVLGTNILYLLSSPFVLLSGSGGVYAVVATALLFGWSLIRRRQLMPDLFVALYCLMLLTWAFPPQRFVAPIFPLVLWIAWRGFQNAKLQEAVAAVAIIVAAIPMVVGISRVPATLRYGQFPTGGGQPSDWYQLERVFSYIRSSTPPDAVILANLDPMFYLNTGRKAIRGFVPDGYKLYYAPSNSVITPDQLGKQILENGVGYVALTPDRDFAEAPAYHRAVQALERGGMLEPVAMPDVSGGYRLLKKR